MSQSYLEKRIPAKNLARYYRLEATPNLFGEWSLIRAWGRIGTNGQSCIAWFATEAEAMAALKTIEAAKRRRGYWKEPVQLVMFE